MSLDCIRQGTHHIQRMYTLFQLAKLEQFLYQNQPTYQGQHVILAVFPSVQSDIEKELLIFSHRLIVMKIEFVIDVVHIRFSLLGTVCRLAEQCIIFSIGRFDWQRLAGSDLMLGGQWCQFARVAAPTSFGQEVDLFLDRTFELKERFGLQIIVDRLQSRTQMQIAKRSPYYGLLGDFISRVRQLEVGENNAELEGMELASAPISGWA